VLHFFGLATTSDQRLSRGSRAAAPAEPVARDEVIAGEDRPTPRRETAERHARTALVYFGLAEHPDRSRYGEVSPQLDADLDALRARVAELEAQLLALSRQPGGDTPPAGSVK
jgi:hypothetical protein